MMEIGAGLLADCAATALEFLPVPADMIERAEAAAAAARWRSCSEDRMRPAERGMATACGRADLPFFLAAFFLSLGLAPFLSRACVVLVAMGFRTFTLMVLAVPRTRTSSSRCVALRPRMRPVDVAAGEPSWLLKAVTAEPALPAGVFTDTVMVAVVAPGTRVVVTVGQEQACKSRP